MILRATSLGVSSAESLDRAVRRKSRGVKASSPSPRGARIIRRNAWFSAPFDSGCCGSRGAGTSQGESGSASRSNASMHCFIRGEMGNTCSRCDLLRVPCIHNPNCRSNSVFCACTISSGRRALTRHKRSAQRTCSDNAQLSSPCQKTQISASVSCRLRGGVERPATSRFFIEAIGE